MATQGHQQSIAAHTDQQVAHVIGDGTHAGGTLRCLSPLVRPSSHVGEFALTARQPVVEASDPQPMPPRRCNSSVATDSVPRHRITVTTATTNKANSTTTVVAARTGKPLCPPVWLGRLPRIEPW